MITPASREWLRLHEHYRNGILPFAGGLLDQPHAYAEAMQVLAEREREILAQRVERQQREAAMAGRFGGLN